MWAKSEQVGYHNDLLNYFCALKSWGTPINTDALLETANYHTFEVNRNCGNMKVSIDGTVKYTSNGVGDPSDNMAVILYNYYSGTMLVDWTYVRKYTTNEPTHGTWSG